jgi:hypothetical protein
MANSRDHAAGKRVFVGPFYYIVELRLTPSPYVVIKVAAWKCTVQS